MATSSNPSSFFIGGGGNKTTVFLKMSAIKSTYTYHSCVLGAKYNCIINLSIIIDDNNQTL